MLFGCLTEFLCCCIDPLLDWLLYSYIDIRARNPLKRVFPSSNPRQKSISSFSNQRSKRTCRNPLSVCLLVRIQEERGVTDDSTASPFAFAFSTINTVRHRSNIKTSRLRQSTDRGTASQSSRSRQSSHIGAEAARVGSGAVQTFSAAARSKVHAGLVLSTRGPSSPQ